MNGDMMDAVLEWISRDLVGGRKPCGQGFAVGKSSDLWVYATAPGGVVDGRFCPGDKN